ncbi:unnamed protein product [Ceratitis capitata]|uniref:(Mediterranean fruit fly) hypothetical protein n=1 Tax=Ceratitis capitata TaxID=7213 RepID=A0A811V141_CERCA|nr:unnamed protein product [Ceratitis capitata]
MYNTYYIYMGEYCTCLVTKYSYLNLTTTQFPLRLLHLLHNDTNAPNALNALNAFEMQRKFMFIANGNQLISCSVNSKPQFSPTKMGKQWPSTPTDLSPHREKLKQATA